MDILIIEDDNFMLELLQRIIENMGHKVHVAENGEDAIKQTQEQKFDLIISDIMMPGISGLSLVTALRTVHHSETPIIMMSTLINKPLLEAAFKKGANDYIVKPFSVENITEKIRKFENIAT